MKHKRFTRAIAGAAALSVIALGVGLVQDAVPVGAATTAIKLSCDGADNDNAGKLGTSKATLAGISALNPGAAAGLSLDVNVDVNAPTKVKKGSGAIPVSFTFHVVLPASVTKPAVDILKLDHVTLHTGTFAVNYSGAATGTLTKSVSELSVGLTGNVSIDQTISGSITPTGDGQIKYTPGTTTLAIGIDATTPIQIGTLNVICNSPTTLGATLISVPGSPNVDPGVIPIKGTGGSLAGVDVTKYITTDNNNPLIPGSLKVTKGATKGFGLAIGNSLFYVGPNEGGTYETEMSICAASVATVAVPGINNIQQVSLPAVIQQWTNPHLIAFSLKVGDKESPLLQTGFDLFNQPGGIDTAQGEAFNANFLGHYVAPNAAQVQAILEATAGIGVGNVKVTEVAPASSDFSQTFNVEFIGALAGKEMPEITVGKAPSWPDPGIKTALLGALNPAPTTTLPNAPTTTAGPPSIADQLLANIDPKAALDAVTKMFAGPIGAKLIRNGEAPIPSTQTGPLCTPFTVQWSLEAAPKVLPASETKVCPTKTVVKKVRVKVRGKYTYVRRTYVVPNCPPVCTTKNVVKNVRVKVNGKYRYVKRTVAVKTCKKA